MEAVPGVFKFQTAICFMPDIAVALPPKAIAMHCVLYKLVSHLARRSREQIISLRDVRSIKHDPEIML